MPGSMTWGELFHELAEQERWRLRNILARLFGLREDTTWRDIEKEMA